MFKNNFILLNRYKNGLTKFSLNELKYEQSIINNNNLKFLLILLLTILFYIFGQNDFLDKDSEDNISLNNFKLNDNESVMHNYSLYNLYKYNQISILITLVNERKIDDISLLNFIDNLKNQTLKEIQIIFILSKTEKNLKETEIKKDKRVKFFFSTNNIEFDIIYLLNLINGKYIFLLDKLILFEKDDLEKIIFKTNGKIDNYFQISIENNSFYLIKTKILRKLVDDGQYFNNSLDIINKFISLSTPHLNYIHITMCPNDYYVPLTYVSMISILSSKDEFTFISFYLIISKDFQKKNINFLLSLYEQFDYFNISFIEIDDRYKNAFISKRMTIQTYFRFSLGEIFPNLNRMIYLDSDIIVYKDLNTLYNLNFNGKMVLGQITLFNRSKKTGTFKINNGILLFNLIQMRKMKIEKEVLNIIKKGEKLRYHDQTLMNKYFQKFIGIFPLEYNVRNWENIRKMKNWNKLTGKIYDEDYVYFSQKYPFIRHYIGGHNKPMNSNKAHIEDWWFFARKSKYYRQKTFQIQNIFSFNK